MDSKKWSLLALSALPFVGLGAPVRAAEPAASAQTVEQAFREADFIVDWRARYESVDQQGFSETADAVTNRLRIGLQTAPLKHTSLLAEGIVIDAVVDDYNSTTNGHTQYPVVADPADFAAVNRFAIVNQSLENTTLTFGRQRLILDDARFVGNVGWRQHEQTFDGARAQLARAGAKVDVTYASQVNRVFGPDSPQGKWEGDFILANLSRAFPVGTLTIFDYYMDIDQAAAASNDTLGAKLAGSKRLGSVGASYALAFARQFEAGANPADLAENYYLLEGGLGFKKLGATLGYEVLGGNGTTAFMTPLATLHAFQGWADKFLGTPAGGIQDRYVKLAYPFGKHGPFTNIAALGLFHDFVADAGGAHYGDELDLQLVARTEHMALTLKYADYRADQLLTDTDKLWLSIEYAF
jgi:Alginate export